MKNIICHFGGGFNKILILENIKTGVKKEFPYTECPIKIKEYAKQIL